MDDLFKKSAGQIILLSFVQNAVWKPNQTIALKWKEIYGMEFKLKNPRIIQIVPWIFLSVPRTVKVVPMGPIFQCTL